MSGNITRDPLIAALHIALSKFNEEKSFLRVQHTMSCKKEPSDETPFEGRAQKSDFPKFIKPIDHDFYGGKKDVT